MSKQIAIGPREVLAYLSVSPIEEDHLALQSIIGGSIWKADNLAAAQALLQQHDIAVVLCERDLRPGTWIDLLDRIHAQAHAPSLIVTSRLADELLWSEALNRGAWDVVAKPFDRSEVMRCVKTAWHHWHNVTCMPAAFKVMRAAS